MNKENHIKNIHKRFSNEMIGIGNNTNYDTRELKISQILNIYKKNKKAMVFKYPLHHYAKTTNLLAMLLMNMKPSTEIVFSHDYKFMIGYDDIKVIHKWVNKGVPIISLRDGSKIFFNKMPLSWQERFLEKTLRCRVFSDEASIDNINHRYFGDNLVLDYRK